MNVAAGEADGEAEDDIKPRCNHGFDGENGGRNGRYSGHIALFHAADAISPHLSAVFSKKKSNFARDI